MGRSCESVVCDLFFVEANAGAGRGRAIVGGILGFTNDLVVNVYVNTTNMVLKVD